MYVAKFFPDIGTTTHDDITLLPGASRVSSENIKVLLSFYSIIFDKTLEIAYESTFLYYNSKGKKTKKKILK